MTDPGEGFGEAFAWKVLENRKLPMSNDKPEFSHLPMTIRGSKIFGRSTIEIDRDMVRIVETGPFADNWEEPLSAYEGVLRETEVYEPGFLDRSTGYTYHRVVLLHPDRKRTLRLYTSHKDDGIRKVWEDAARALGLPALHETPDGTVSRSPKDLDKSVRQLAAEGKLSVDFDADTPPPRGITWEQVDSEMRVTLSLGAKSYGRDAIKIVVGALAVLVATAGFLAGVLEYATTVAGTGRDAAILAWLVGGVLVVAGGRGLSLDAIGKRHIVITPGELSYFRKTPFGVFGRKSIPLHELENLRRAPASPIFLAGILPVSSTRHRRLLIESDTTKISVGGLGEPQVRWLRQFILSTMINKPRG